MQNKQAEPKVYLLKVIGEDKGIAQIGKFKDKVVFYDKLAVLKEQDGFVSVDANYVSIKKPTTHLKTIPELVIESVCMLSVIQESLDKYVFLTLSKKRIGSLHLSLEHNINDYFSNASDDVQKRYYDSTRAIIKTVNDLDATDELKIFCLITEMLLTMNSLAENRIIFKHGLSDALFDFRKAIEKHINLSKYQEVMEVIHNIKVI